MTDDLAEIRALVAEDDKSAALRRALRALDRAKASREELVAAVYQAAKDAASAASVPPVPKYVVPNRKMVRNDDPVAARLRQEVLGLVA